MELILRRKRGILLLFTLTILLGTITSTFASANDQIPKMAALPNQWNPLTGPVGTGMNWPVYDFAIDKDGNLYAGGSFTTSGGVSANRVAKWDGTQWTALGAGMNLPVYALATDNDGNLYAGGTFTTAGSVIANRVAKWDGTQWTGLGAGMNLPVYTMTMDSNGNLYAGGGFTSAGGVTVNYVAKWDGIQWAALGTGMNGVIWDLVIDKNGDLYAGGSFTTAGGVAASRVAKWDGTQWTALGAGMNWAVYSLTMDNNGNLYAGGTFTTAGGVAANQVAKWDGTQWTALGTGMNWPVDALVTDNTGNLYAGGRFTTSGGITVNYVAKWDGIQWTALASGMNDWVRTLATDNLGNLYAGGHFTTAGGNTVNYVSYYDFNYSIPTILTGGIGSIEDTGDGSISEGESTSAQITRLTVSFSEDVFDPIGDTDVDDVTNPDNYHLIKDNSIGIVINSVSYSNSGGSGPFIASVDINDGLALQPGDYAFTVVGTTSITSSASGISLAGDGVNPGTDFVRNFSVTAATTAENLPSTGFIPGIKKDLPAQPAHKQYTELGDLWLEIPSLNVQTSIVGVPLSDGEWDVKWLGNRSGWLHGSSFPTWPGNTILTGHIWDENNNPGLFANLKNLSYGDKIFVHAWGLIYTYEVRQSMLLEPNQVNSIFQHEEYDWLTLVTCENYNPVQDTYLYRRAIKAILVAVQ